MMEISWTGHVRNEEVLRIVKEESNAVRGIKRRKANWIGHNLHSNCLLKQLLKDISDGKTRKKT